ncbi:hypothetical protein [Pseudomonas aeruginosa]|uniref:hypothetical protein n=1 Tax=Pseudomonas aeruginosa TaxID=287 RepID=UPI001794837C|nr:hypothetical protein [Pseudomonas aeruginosa]MDE8657653.1 hypothetical protein [Pseudomonas aeruginosa]MDE8663410.1 hypothetical protein [Pseudomonas aeruginosa]HBN8432882.1 hypothetical protein [Pseudomonas aeruginosa]HBO4445824.1 hypothetical protein [Pseudomonas aeruginosa]HCE5832987.1 hypothetical protein [Pseudomonas aeruginosa]
MLHSNKLDALFQLLEEMTGATKGESAFAPSRRMQRIENWLMGGFITTILIFVAVAAWYRFVSGAPVQSVPRPVYVIYSLNLMFAILYLATVAIGVVRLFWRHRRERFAAILATLKSELHSDAELLARLWVFDKPTLEYGLLQYRHRWESFDGRVTVLAGDLRKLGLFPALAAASISAATLLKEGSNFFLWAPLILACCFYLMAFYALAQRERPRQVIALLEYAVRYANEPFNPAPTEGVTGMATLLDDHQPSPSV